MLMRGTPGDYTNYRISAPLSTHFRRATCAEVNCPEYANGWKLRKENLSPELLHTATHPGRKFVLLQEAEGVNWLIYEAGQPCFQAMRHRTRIDRAERFLVHEGTGRPRRHTKAEFWAEELHEVHDKLDELRKKG